jgi:hypothetical protein
MIGYAYDPNYTGCKKHRNRRIDEAFGHRFKIVNVTGISSPNSREEYGFILYFASQFPSDSRKVGDLELTIDNLKWFSE